MTIALHFLNCHDWLIVTHTCSIILKLCRISSTLIKYLKWFQSPNEKVKLFDSQLVASPVLSQHLSFFF